MGVHTAITRNNPVTAQLSNDSVVSRSVAIVGSDAETIVIDDVNTTIAEITVSSRRRGYRRSSTTRPSHASTAVVETQESSRPMRRPGYFFEMGVPLRIAAAACSVRGGAHRRRANFLDDGLRNALDPTDAKP